MFLSGSQFDELRVATTWREAIGIPEPASLAVLAIGAIGAIGLARRRR